MHRVRKCYFHIQSIYKLCIFVEAELDFLFHFPDKVVAPLKFACIHAGLWREG